MEKLLSQINRTIEIQTRPHATKQSTQTLRSVVDRMLQQQQQLHGILNQLVALQVKLNVDQLVYLNVFLDLHAATNRSIATSSL